MKNKGLKHKLTLALLLCCASQPAHALSCLSKENEAIGQLYKIYVKTGYAPQGRIDDYTDLGTGVSVNGTLTGITNYESCWKDSPPCDRKAEYASVHINFLTTTTEVQKVYGSDPKNVLQECFRKIGLAAQKKSSSFERMLPW
ncbi:MAG: hypothetical protein K2Q01_07580 [Rickettsiales bacterium]|nr:hypothetical protein [Rickettsiales bacterium]